MQTSHTGILMPDRPPPFFIADHLGARLPQQHRLAKGRSYRVAAEWARPGRLAGTGECDRRTSQARFRRSNDQRKRSTALPGGPGCFRDWLRLFVIRHMGKLAHPKCGEGDWSAEQAASRATPATRWSRRLVGNTRCGCGGYVARRAPTSFCAPSRRQRPTSSAR